MRFGLLGFGLAAVLVLGCDDYESATPHPAPVKSSRPAPTHGVRDELGPTHAAVAGSGGKVTLGGISLAAPDSWPRKAAQSTFIQAEFVLPGGNGTEAAGRLTLSTAGGSIDDNIERWKGQFGAAAKLKTEKLEVNGVQVTLVDLSGDFDDQRGPYAPAVKRSNYRMIAAIIPAQGELHFIKAVGPQATMDLRAAEINAFLRTVRVNN